MDIQATVPDLGKIKQQQGAAFTPGVLVIESSVLPLDPQPLGSEYLPPLLPINPATEAFVKSREVRRHSDNRVEVITLRYENPVEQKARLEWLEAATAELEAEEGPCVHCGSPSDSLYHVMARVDAEDHEQEFIHDWEAMNGDESA